MDEREYPLRSRADELLESGKAAEDAGDYERACMLYEQAAGEGSAAAMLRIANLYLTKPFRQVKQSNLLQLLQQGIPALPWTLSEESVPDYGRALEWCLKAAQAGSASACLSAGLMLCEGMGCRANVAEGTAYLERAASAGVKAAENYLHLYRGSGERLGDAEYEACLAAFAGAVDRGDDARYRLYATLRSGTPRQLARLGYVLSAAQNDMRQEYYEFSCAEDEAGLPLVPVSIRRAAWRTALRFDLNAFDEEEPLIAFSSDILDPDDSDWMFSCLYHLRPAGRASYLSPAFGWLGEEKRALVLRVDRSAGPGPNVLDKLCSSLRLAPEQFLGSSTALAVENGEKEYSVEIAHLSPAGVHILKHYTIGGSETIKTPFPPKLKSLKLREG